MTNFRALVLACLLSFGCGVEPGTLVGWEVALPVPTTSICTSPTPLCTVDRSYTCGGSGAAACDAPSFPEAATAVDAEFREGAAGRRGIFCMVDNRPIHYLEVLAGFTYQVRYYDAGKLIAAVIFSDVQSAKQECNWTYWGKLPPGCCM